MSGNWLRATLRRVGWCYVGYHVLVGSLLVVNFYLDTRTGYWREPGVLIELGALVLIYPPLIPTFAVCGGPHAGCETLLGHLAQVTVLAFSVIWVATGVRTLILSVRGPNRK